MKFDGANKLIILENETVLNIKEMYLKWKEWASDLKNLKYPVAMKYVGGDKLPNSYLGLTFFLINGWKIKPASKDYTIEVVGNIYSNDEEPIFVKADGDVNVLIVNKVSNLIDIVYPKLYNNTNPTVTALTNTSSEEVTSADDGWTISD